MGSIAAFIPMDRRQAIGRGETLPDRIQGAVLFADISGYTPLTKALMKELGEKHGVDELTQHINGVFKSLISELHRYQGSVIGFGGDAITCWLDGDDGLRAITCALAMQQVMTDLSAIETPDGETYPLSVKIAVTVGEVRRFSIGDPSIQRLDVLAGATLKRMADAEDHAEAGGEIIIGPKSVMTHIIDKVVITEWREKNSGAPSNGEHLFALVDGLQADLVIDPEPWPPLTSIESTTEIPLETATSWLLQPVYERWQPVQGQFLADIRPVVALFLKFSGIEYDDDPDAGEKLDTFIRWLQQTLATYEGYLMKLTIGDKGSYCFATFGAPLAHDDDEHRALSAALELKIAPLIFEFIKDVQIGLSQGRMLAGAFGSPDRMAYDLLGSEANMAARLMTLAKPGQVLASERVVQAVARSYLFSTPTMQKIKGFDEPLPVYEVLKQMPPEIPNFTTRLVGRAEELSQMVQQLEEVLNGQGQILQLLGPPGIGKSHLVAEFTEWAKLIGFNVGLGTSESTNQQVSYYPWRQLIRKMFGLPEPISTSISVQVASVEKLIVEINPDWSILTPLLDDLLGLSIPDNPTTAAYDVQSRHKALATLLGGVLAQQAQEQPLVLVFDDVQWMDERSKELTLAICRSLVDTPIMVILVQRPLAQKQDNQPLFADLNQLSHHRHLTLAELSEDGIAALVKERLPGDTSPLALALITAITQGNPFFVEELVDALQELGRLVYRDSDKVWTLSDETIRRLREKNCLTRDPSTGDWGLVPEAPLSTVDLGTPISIHQLVLSRVDRLNEAQKLTIKTASVIGRSFTLDLLTQSHPSRPPKSVLTEQIDVLENNNFVYSAPEAPKEQYFFKHHITQEVTYTSLREEQQKLLHQWVGQALEALTPDAVELLAYHYFRSGLREKSILYLEKAARKSKREYATEAALNYYNQALTLDNHLEWLKEKIEVLHILGRREEEKAALKALELEPNESTYEVSFLWGQYYEAIGDYDQAQINIAMTLSTYKNLTNRINQVRCLAQLGLISRRQGKYNKAKKWYKQALNLFQDKILLSDEEIQAVIQVNNGLGVVCYQQGIYEQAKHFYQQALALSKQHNQKFGEADALNGLGVIAFYQRNLDQALSYHKQVLFIRHLTGDLVGEGNSLTNLGKVTRDAGDYGQAQKYLADALKIQQATTNRWEEVNIWIDLGGLHYELGEMPMAQSCLEKGLYLSRQIGDEAGEAFVLCNLGLVLAESGDLLTAERVLRDGLQLAKKQDDKDLASSFYFYLSLISLQANRPQQAIIEAQTALTLRSELNLPLRTVDDLSTLAAAYLVIGKVKESLDKAQEALTILEQFQGEGPEFPQRAYFICYQVLTTAGKLEQAQMALHAAYDLVMSRANNISDPTQRDSFLYGRKMNVDILHTYRKQNDTDQFVK